MERIEHIREFGGWLERYTHDSAACNCRMTFSVYLPPQAEAAPVPAVYFLSGLTCTDDNVRVKAGAQRYAAELGLALVMPDTSPRGEQVADAPDRYDLGQGAGFYINAAREPWAAHYRMFDYVNLELPTLVERELPLIPGRRSITGHSMGGHGALISALKNPGLYRSVSAFAPICNPVESAWGRGCFAAYLGEDTPSWKDWDATELIRAGAESLPLFIDQGTDDEFLIEGQLRPEALSQACKERGIPLILRMQPDYDHSYHFIATFIGEHLAYHARALTARS
ncbi:S-formylglutathione hydrolase [Thiocapsa bogorovii]|uniref:S-formylglutathione hydrolase n=1 Tax=Thiocapsa bogorovii TaxID=521689 RepID=UPI001E55D8A2|nr:S-formylglutathione hydrolase [Thiocapsa bogorovii]UHD16146.1 S-formylglutathione hydrolase [Thiocapsa bogorovii]